MALDANRLNKLKTFGTQPQTPRATKYPTTVPANVQQAMQAQANFKPAPVVSSTPKKATTATTTATPKKTTATAPPPAQSQNNMFNNLFDQSAEQEKAIKQAAQDEYNRQIQASQAQIDELNRLKQTDIDLLNQNTRLAQNQLDSRMYDQYLQTLDNIAKRGLGMSGLGQDAITRLDMVKQEQLANLYAQTQNQMNELNKYYSPQIAQIQAQRQMITPESIEKQKMADFYNQQLKQADVMAKYLPYTTLTKYQRQSLENDRARASSGSSQPATPTMDIKGYVTQLNKSIDTLENYRDNRQSLLQSWNQAGQGNSQQAQEITRNILTAEAKIDAADALAQALSRGNQQEIAIAQARYDALKNPPDVAQQPTTPQTGKTPAQIVRENEQARKKGSVTQFQKAIPTYQLIASNIDRKDAVDAINMLGKAGVKIQLTQRQYNQLEDLSKQNPSFRKGVAESVRIENAKKMFPLIKKYGFDIIG